MKAGKVKPQAMSEAAKEARNAYLRAWKARNKDRVREYNRTYWERKADRLAAENA